MNIRLATPDDADRIVAIYAPIVRDTAISFEIDAPGVGEMRTRIAKTLRTYPWLVAETAGQLLGYAYASQHRERAAYRWAVDTTVYIAEAARGQGVGRALYSALFAWLVRQGYRQAFAGIALPNAASVGLHEAVGFTPVGIYRKVGFKHGRWHDVGRWQATLIDSDAAPDEPVPMADLRL